MERLKIKADLELGVGRANAAGRFWFTDIYAPVLLAFYGIRGRLA